MTIDFKNKKVLVTAGGTYENIDPIRFIGNRSSGKMGIAIANALQKKNANVILVKANTIDTIRIHKSIKIIYKTTAKEMFNACMEFFPTVDIVIMAAAVADYAPKEVAKHKIKKNASSLVLELKKTKDILFELGKIKSNKQYIVGFALETQNGEENAKSKMQRKNCDMIILNSLSKQNNPFGADTNSISIFTKKKNPIHLQNKTKNKLATIIIENIYCDTN